MTIRDVRTLSSRDYARARSPAGIRAALRAQEQPEPAVERPGDNRFTDRSDSRRRGYDDALNLANRLAQAGGVQNLSPEAYGRARREMSSVLRRSNGYVPPRQPAAPSNDNPDDTPPAAA
jgi:hypothetical protein